MIKIILLLTPLIGTSIGAYLGILKHNTKGNIDVQEDSLVAIATGILGTISISLCAETIEYRRNIYLAIGFLFGIIFIFLINKITNQETTHAKLFWAMLVHNIPEGILIGIALSGQITIQSLSLIASVSLQNIPDGLVVSLAASSKHEKNKALSLGILSGIVEPIATALIIFLVQNADIYKIEPLFIGFSVITILHIELELLKDCTKIRTAAISFLVTTLFNWILG